MTGKKGEIPSHIRIKKFNHPAADRLAIAILDSVKDPRKPSQFFRHSLTSVLFMTVVAVICGADDWSKVVAMAEGMLDWLAQYVDMSAGVPCERTFVNIFNVIDPSEMERALRELSSLVREKFPKETVSFDGQTARGTADVSKNVKGIHLLHAWSFENGLCLGQLKVDDKSNEITSMPQLMDQLDLKGAVITADAMNTQKAIVAKAIEKGADYVLPVKENQPGLLQEVRLSFEGFDRECALAKAQWEHAIAKSREHRDEPRLQRLLSEGYFPCGASYWKEDVAKAHGRIEERLYTAISAKDLPSGKDWAGISYIVRVCRFRQKADKKSTETVFYITSLDADSQLIGNSIRKHWAVENQLHWRLDVIFRQDKSRYRNRVGAQNMAIIRKMALHALSKETSMKRGIATKQCAAACSPEYRDGVIKNLF